MTADLQTDWIAVDWGTSNLRAWAMRGDRSVAGAESEDGMARLARAEFEPALLALIEPWLAAGRSTDVVACGMVGSRQGWVEAPYAPVPCAPPRAFARPEAHDPRIRVYVLPGVRQDAPPDVIRGEETKFAGLLAAEPAFDGVAVSPGTHTKWAHLSAGEIVSFSSFMTGELFALLSERSVLRHSVGGGGWSPPDFDEAVADGLTHPERLAQRLFGLRAAGLLHGLPPERARARLSGLLIGAELAGARPYWLGREVVLIGKPALNAAYSAALACVGQQARALDATETTLRGLATARADLARSPR